MKKHKHSVFIIDQDHDFSMKMVSTVEPIFTTVYVQNDLKLFEMDYLGLKPNVLLLNLNLNQREAAFNFLEKTLPKLELKPLVYGYMDSAENEFMAHAVENGIQDVFVRPFDTDIIASKINKHINNEESLKIDIPYVRLLSPLKAKLELKFKILSIDENGLTLTGLNYISKGTKFSMNNPLIQEIFGTPSMQLMVTKTWFDEATGNYHLFTEPKDSNEVTRSALRRFILSKI